MNDWNTGTEKTVAARACAFITSIAYAAVADHERFTMVLAGGNSPRGLYAMLASGVDETQFTHIGLEVPRHAVRSKHCRSCILLPWHSTWLFQGDERYVEPGHPDSNYGMAYDTLVRHTDIPSDHIFRMPVEEHLPESAAIRYEQSLSVFFHAKDEPSQTRYPEFDLIILGLGSDGHTASLFPGNPVLDEQTRWVAPVEAPPGNPSSIRLTLSLPVINNAAHIIFFVSGGRERLALQVRNGERADLPAGRIRPRSGKPFWFVVQS
jgi:6-phosphogluconolactonase